MSLTLIRRARASRLSAARCACDTARARHPARADGRGLLVVRFLWCTPRTARFVATVGQIFWRLRRAARSDLDESKACGTHEHALGGLSTKSYSRFVLRCSRKEASTNFRRLRRAVVLCTHNLASLACGSIVRPSYYENRSRRMPTPPHADTQIRRISSFCHGKSKIFGACGELSQTLIS